MNVSQNKGKLMLALDGTEADMLILLLRYVAYGAPLDQKQCEEHFHVDKDTIQRFYDELRSKYP